MANPEGPGQREREAVSFLVFSASFRSDSLNGRLASLAAATIEANGGSVDLAAMRAFDTPSYDADAQLEGGFPRGRRTCRTAYRRGTPS